MTLDLTKAVLPSTISVGGRTYRIRTWFKHWLRFLEICRNPEEGRDFSFLFEGDVPEDKAGAFLELEKFASPESELPRPSGESSGKVIDYGHDGALIYAAFMQQYGIDLIDAEGLHWWKFLALMEGLHGTKLNDVMEARMYDPDDKTTYDEAKKKARAAWTLEGLETVAEKSDAEARFEESFG